MRALREREVALSLCYDKTQRRMILASATLKEGGGRAYSNRSRLNQLKAKVHEAGNGSLIYKREMVCESAQSRVLNETCRRTMLHRDRSGVWMMSCLEAHSEAETGEAAM